jgi:hypothetical protein
MFGQSFAWRWRGVPAAPGTVVSATRFERISGFSALRAGQRRIEVTVRRSGDRWVAVTVERSGGGGHHGDDD